MELADLSIVYSSFGYCRFSSKQEKGNGWFEQSDLPS